MEPFISQKNAKNQYALLPGISVTVLASHFSSVIGNFRSSGRLDLQVWYLKMFVNASETENYRSMWHHSTCIITSITALPIGLAAILVIILVSTFKTAIILYISCIRSYQRSQIYERIETFWMGHSKNWHKSKLVYIVC